MSANLSLARALNPIRMRIGRLIAKIIVDNIDDSTKTQLIKGTLFEGEVRRDMLKVHDFGFTSHAPVDNETEGYGVCINGDRGNTVVLVNHNRSLRIKDLEEGATAIYCKDGSDSNANRIVLKPTKNEISISTADGNQVTINEDGIYVEDTHGNIIETSSTKVEINGNLEVLQ